MQYAVGYNVIVPPFENQVALRQGAIFWFNAKLLAAFTQMARTQHNKQLSYIANFAKIAK